MRRGNDDARNDAHRKVAAMGDLLDLTNQGPLRNRVVPDPHRLFVWDHPDDGMHVIHPDSCKREHCQWDDGTPYVVYLCPVQWHLDALGPDYLFRHAFDDPYPGDWREPLLPGIYTFHYAVTIWYSSRVSMFDDSDSDEEIDAVPQGMLGTGYLVPFKCAQRSPWSRQEWDAAHDQCEALLGGEAWETVVNLAEVTGTHPHYAVTALVTAMNAFEEEISMGDEKWTEPKVDTVKNPGAKTPDPPAEDNGNGEDSD